MGYAAAALLVIDGPTLVLRELAGGPKSRAQLKSAFKQHGFAETSCSATLSKLRREGKIVQEPMDKFRVQQ